MFTGACVRGMNDLSDLISVLENEVQLGKELSHNLAAQKEAILSWNSSALIERVEEKETLTRKLGEMEERRQGIVAQLPHSDLEGNPSLRELLTRLPAEPRTVLLGSLLSHARELYNRLRLEEKRLVSLMECILGHIREALSPLSHPILHLYGKSGILSPSGRPQSGLVKGKI